MYINCNTLVCNNLLQVEPKIMKQDTNMRDAISPRLKLATTLRYLATGDSYRSLEYLMRISRSTMSIYSCSVGSNLRVFTTNTYEGNKNLLYFMNLPI